MSESWGIGRYHEVSWSRNLFAALTVGGVWGVPRSGLVFTKLDETTFALTERMPWAPGMPMSEQELRDYQQSDYETIRDRFEAADITVVDRSQSSS